MNPIVQTYSQLANQYGGDENTHSCWGIAADRALASIRLKERYQVVVDVGCGTGRALVRLASQSGLFTHPPRASFSPIHPEPTEVGSLPGNGLFPQDRQLIGVEPAPNMRNLAASLTQEWPQIRITDGTFENIPIESATVDYVYSILAFHWTTDVDRSVNELCRVLKPDGEMDLFFIGRNNGQEFIRKTTPIFLKYMGPVRLLQSAAMRKQLTPDAAFQLFRKKFGDHHLSVEESYDTYYDSLEGHWSWWVRIEGHFVQIPAEKRLECDREVKQALSTLQTLAGIPYTIHLLHVSVRAA